MTFFYVGRAREPIARFLLLLMACQLSSPLAGWALTSGPTQPEFSGFESVNTKDLVNKFTGDFSYTLPLLEVPGPAGSSYPVTLSYHSGANAEDEASWVGYGWNLNPGAINRNVRGLPDDFYNEEVTYTNRLPINRTFTLGTSAGLEVFSGDLGFSANSSLRYNTTTGFGSEEGFGITLGKGIVTLGVEQTDGRRTFSGRINPMQVLASMDAHKATAERKELGDKQAHEKHKDDVYRPTVGSMMFNAAKKALNANTSFNVAGGNHGLLDFNEGSWPTMVSQYSGNSFNVTLGAAVNVGPFPVGGNFNVSGSYAYQQALETDKLPGYGYLYAKAATQTKNTSGDQNLLTDYYMEKDGPYEKRDVLLGVPFSNADNYAVSGEGIGGGFQLHHSQVGEFGPNARTSSMMLYNAGADISLGWTFGWGANASVGRHTLEQASWDSQLANFSDLGDGSYFRFTNDLGGMAGGALANDYPVAAGMQAASGGYALVKSGLTALMGASGEAPRQASHIGQHTVAQTGRPAMFRYCRRSDIDALRERPKKGDGSGNVQQQALAEFRVTNEGGQQYTYGLPVYARNEVSMQYGMQGTAATNIKRNYLIYGIRDNDKVQAGMTRNGAYATSYLLTEITGPDYVDRNLNGPDEADFGGYTAFSYVKPYGGQGAASSSWYRWRFPFTGHHYQMGSLSDAKDDMGEVLSGDKEICYLQAIHTKTHTAIFRISTRDDGWAAGNEVAARQDSLEKGTGRLSRLDRIELYANADVKQVATTDAYGNTQLTWEAKNSSVVPLKQVDLGYDYSLCPQTPNSTAATQGKLTLLQVKTTYNGVSLARPYQFGYTYPSYSGTEAYPSKYAGFSANYQFSSAAQNPAYQQYCLDSWGNYQGNGAGLTRHLALQPWPDQRGLEAGVDPAAWQLKRIVLPSGGEIHVQYEPDDYAYVQDQPAAALASLSTLTNDQSAIARTDFMLDPTSVGVARLSASPTVTERRQAVRQLLTCCKLLRQQYIGTSSKIYFKFLYKLVTAQRLNPNDYAAAAPADVTDCNTDFVSGYVTLSDVQPDTSSVPFRIKLTLPPSNDWALPQRVCQDFVQTQRLGRLQTIDGNCNPSQVGIDDSETDAVKLFRQFADWATRKPSLLGGSNSSICAALQPSLSYFKIPLPTSKRGGGLRVKRLLTYDRGAGLDDQPVLYGSEYEYQAYDNLTRSWRSSGVATTEPGSMRDENALVVYIPRTQQGDIQKAIAGPDRKQSEGPIGESILPAAAVGYSRVTVKNIHSGKTNPGYSISEFFTCKDAPMQWRMTRLNSLRNYIPLYAVLVNLVTDQCWTTQGFSFILNALHGQPKREATYAGPYSDINQQQSSTLISEQLYEYAGYDNAKREFNPASGEPLLVQNAAEPGGTGYDGSPAASASPLQYPGKEVEVTMAQRAIRDHLNEVKLEYDAPQYTPLGFLGIIFWVSGMVSLNRNTADYYSHATSKVIRYPAIVKRVISAHDGMRDTVDNMVFDRYTGSPVATRSSDGGRGGYWKQTVMASWVYPQLRSKGSSEGLLLSSTSNPWLTKSETDGLYLYATNSTTQSDCKWLASIGRGDVLALGPETDARFTKALYFAETPDIARKRVKLYPYYPGTAPSPVAATGLTSLSIIFSGNTNQLQTQAGSTTYHSSNRRDLSFAPTPDDLDANDPFALALKTAIGNLSSLTSGTAPAQQTFTLTNNGAAFTNVNVAGFADRVPAGNYCGDLSKATVKDLKFLAYYDPATGSVRLQLLSFKLSCQDSSGSMVDVEVK